MRRVRKSRNAVDLILLATVPERGHCIVLIAGIADCW
jgi:hypothetical protein